MEEPFVAMGLQYTKLYFGFFIVYPLVMRAWWRLLMSVGPSGFDKECFFSWFACVGSRVRCR